MMNTKNTIITAVLTSMLTTIVTFFGLDYLKSRRWSEDEKKEVPLILGLTEAQAESVLRQQGFKLSIIEKKPSPDFQENTISMQSPAKGTEVPAGAVISAVLSTGQPEKSIPIVKGKPLTEATRLLTDAGFKLGTISKKKHQSVPKEHVVEINPPQGSKAEKGATVHITLSKGAGTVGVPKLVGKYYGAAKKEIIEEGFVLGKVSWRDNMGRDSYIILGQSPEPGEDAPKGSKIDITVNRGD